MQTTLDILNKIPYGLSSQGSHRSWKTRYSEHAAKTFMKCLPKQYHGTVLMYVTKKNFVILAITDHSNSMIWREIRGAQIKALFEAKKPHGQLKLGL